MSNGNLYKKYSDQPVLFGIVVTLSFAIVSLTTMLGTFLTTENFGKGITLRDGIVCTVLMGIVVMFFLCTIQIAKTMRKRAIQGNKT